MEARIEMPSKLLILLNSAHCRKLGARGCVLLVQKTKIIFRAHN